MIMLAGALEMLWSAHETSWSSRVTDHSIVPVDERLSVLEDHRQVIDAIDDGDARRAHDLAAAHLVDAQHYPGSSGVVDAVDGAQLGAPRSTIDRDLIFI